MKTYDVFLQQASKVVATSVLQRTLCFLDKLDASHKAKINEDGLSLSINNTVLCEWIDLKKNVLLSVEITSAGYICSFYSEKTKFNDMAMGVDAVIQTLHSFF